jgi:metal-dependent HD superfamily phosphatase/phosphodiesterase
MTKNDDSQFIADDNIQTSAGMGYSRMMSAVLAVSRREYADAGTELIDIIARCTLPISKIAALKGHS